MPANPPDLTLAERLSSVRKPVRNANEMHSERLSPLDRVALSITAHVGNFKFFLGIFAWTAFWLTWNLFGPRELRFDPAPAFVFWLFLSNMIQIMLMPLILVGQNLQNRHSELRAENDYVINVKAEREVEFILQQLEHQNILIRKLGEKLGIDPAELAETSSRV